MMNSTLFVPLMSLLSYERGSWQALACFPCVDDVFMPIDDDTDDTDD